MIGLDFDIFFHLENDRPRPQNAFAAWKTHVGSWTAGFETSGLGIEASDQHDQRIVRIARTDDPGICLRIFGGQDDDAHAAIATSYRPFEVGYPLLAYLLRLPSQRRSKSRLIRDATILANNLVVHIATTTVPPSSLIADPPKCRRERAAPKCSKEVESVQPVFIVAATRTPPKADIWSWIASHKPGGRSSNYNNRAKADKPTATAFTLLRPA